MDLATRSHACLSFQIDSLLDKKLGGWKGKEPEMPAGPHFSPKFLTSPRQKCNTMYDYLGASIADLRV
jgi:hypothetical protein